MGLFSGLGNWISGALSTLTSGIREMATSIASLGLSLATKVGEAIKTVGVSLNILRPEDNMDELGEKAMLSDKGPDDFESMSAYIDHLRNDVSLDKEKFDSLSDTDKLERASIGASITLKGINEKLDTVISPSFMATVALLDLDAKEIIGTIKSYKENGLDTADYKLYVNNELSIDETHKHGNALVQAYQKLEPQMSLEQIEDKVMGLKA